MPGVHLSFVERVRIWELHWERRSTRFIAAAIGRHGSTVSRELRRREPGRDYHPEAAQTDANHRRGRPKPFRLAVDHELRAGVGRLLAQDASPEQVAGRLRREHPGDPRWRVSHTTIYHAIYLLGRTRLNAELDVALRSRRAIRKPRGVPYSRLGDIVCIAQRPAEVADRAVPGHWEGDLLTGAAHRSHVGTLVERTSRFTVLVHLPRGKTAAEVRDGVAAAMTRLPEQLRRSLTWDRGTEMAEHARFRVDTGVAVYFCDPHSPWQRPTNENTNGLLRQYLPKGSDLSVHNADDLDAIARRLNGRPRKVLDYATPAEVFDRLLIEADAATVT